MKKKFLALVLTLAMVLSLVPVTALAAGTTQPNIQNSGPVISGDEYVTLEKTAAAVGESDNTFDITLKATVKDGKEAGTKTSTDAVLVIDRSGSMQGNRINSAQQAAKQFAEVVLGNGANDQNQIAVVSYAGSATTNTELSSNLDTVKRAINFKADGGTNIQAGIKAARDILKNSTANNKVILVLSDGEPTYSFLTVGTATQTGCQPGLSILVDHYSGTINPDSVRITGFEYSKVVGTGRNYELKNGTTLSVTCEHGTYPESYTYYKDNGQPTIQEASYAKEDGCEIYSIYLGKSTDSNAVSTMKGIATDETSHYKLATEASELGKLFKGIAEDITLPVTPGMVTDPMGDHMNLVADSLQNNSAVTTNDGGFTWDLTKVTPINNENGSRTYALTYQITFDTDFDGFDATRFYPTNQETTLSYTVNGKQEIAKFPIPAVKGKAVTYQLTYNANGGNEESVPADGKAYTKNETANLNYDDKPTHAKVNEKDVIFIGWSATPDTTIYDKGSTINTSSLIPSIQMDGNKTVYAVWGYDAIGQDNKPDGVPDVFNAVVTYNIVGGTWVDGTDNGTAEKQEVIKVKELKNGVWTDTNNKLAHIPSTEASAVKPNSGFTTDGAWRNPAPTTNTVVKIDTIYTYTLEAAPPAPTYTLTYDANGGKTDSVPTDSNAYTAGQTVNLDYSKDATHNQEGVIFIGWSETNDDGKIYNKGDRIPDLIQSVTMNDNKIVYAVWGLDENGNNTPDVFEATVTYKIENGYWFDSGTDGPVSTDPVTAQFTLYEKKGNQWVAQNPTLGNTIPTGRGADAGYTANGWYKDSETTATSIDAETRVTGDVTYTFKYVKTSTEVTWDVSRSKTATNLDGNYESKVTLSLPSAEEKLATDVVFVLDKSTSATLEQQALDMLTKLKEQAGSTKAKVKVGVVIFNKQANVTPLTDLATGYDTIEQAIKQEIKKGTNTHAGLLAGKQMLDGDTEVSANRKYLIFVSDGISYMYDSDGKVVPYYWRSDTPYTSYDPYSWSFKYGDDNPPADWSAWVTQIGDIIKTENVTPILYAEHKAAVDNKTLDISQYTDVTDFATNQYTTCVDRALYYTYQTYTAAKNEGYNCYAVVNGSSTTYPWGPDFMNYLADGKTVNFDKIQNDILYAVSAGSTVIDTIGEKFTFGGVDSFTLKVGTKEIKGVKDASDANTVNFGEQKSNGKYQYTVTYIPDTKTFAWTINENVSNFAPVQLTYTVKLTKPETAAGTYGQTDLNGDTFIDGTQTKVDTGKALYTNQSATLLPVNSAGKPGQLLLFPMPSVSYTIKGSSGGHGGNGGGTVTIPDDVPTGLNGKDHYAYVVGYPDGMVYPQKNITRAEVATIFFRLLTDETREANMTKSNGYNDMKDGAWYTCAVSTLSKMGIIKGYEDGSFKPDASISRAEFAAIAARFDPDGDKTPATFSDVSSHWAKDEISIAANHGWIKGYEDGSFKPDQKITRAETMTLVNRVLKRLPETKDDLHKDMKTWPDNQKESAWFYLAVQEATNSHYQKLKKDGIHETWESMRETRDWAALEK